ncbi:VanZ family protein [Brevibacillus nitrificans]|uniref:VanZ family protein n=1 Tax=Brevibacillus nitrificans TaxID=651560 RepID=UPI0026311E9A|nr:VanZ family protein [Brevibacillus nitrificans]MED1795547.1 VanZ family protein [Brevibacillus nitrificans]
MKKATDFLLRATFSVAFALYLILVIKVLLFKFSWTNAPKVFPSIAHSLSQPQLIWEALTNRGNLIPFHEIMKYMDNLLAGGNMHSNVNFIGNVIAFLPFGFLLPFLQKEKNRSLVTVTILSFLFSLCMEGTQLLASIGTFDVDDLLLNTTGGMIGYGIFQSLRSIFQQRYSKRVTQEESL